jgi:long-chain acyl-CoA synthetase
MTAPASLEDAATEGRVVAWFAAREPDRPAVVAERGTLTFAELDARINRLVRALRARGIGAGDAIALAAPNRAEWVETFAAAQRAGLRITPINWHLGREEAEYIVRDCGARAVVVDGSLGELAAAAADAPVRLVIGPTAGAAWTGWEDYETALGAESGAAIEDPVRGSIMLYTSGTTGRPKGVSRPPEDPATALTAARFSGYAPGMVHLVTGPLYHTAPLLLSMNTPLHGGATLVLMERWDAAETLRLVEEHRVTHTHMVPTMFHRLLALPEATRTAADTSSFLAVIHGAAPCPVHVKERLIEWLGPVVWEYYGATEGAATLVDSHTWLTKPGTVGRPEPRDHVKVGDEDGAPLPTGTAGLVWIRSKPDDRFVYHGDPAKTEGAYRGEYFTLGDVGYLDEDGFLFLTDRSAHLIVSGGVNIYPAEVDAVLLEHRAVADAATIGVPDDEWGESVLAVVEVRDGVTADAALADELIAFCRTKLAAFKCPRGVDFVGTLPRQDNGKVAKTKLRDGYREDPRYAR